MTWTITERPWNDPDGTALRAAQRAELDTRYGSDDHEPGTPPSAADIDVFLVAVRDGRAIGCGALRRLDATTASSIRRCGEHPRDSHRHKPDAIATEFDHVVDV